MPTPQLLGLVGSPNRGGRSLAALEALFAGARSTGASTEIVELADDPDPETVQRAIEGADGIAFATPTYRARSSSLIKQVLESTERGAAGERRAPLLGKATALVHTGATAHHFLAVDDLRSVLAGFFAAQVLSPGLYFEAADYRDATTLTERAGELADAHGRAFAAFTAAVRAAPAVTALRPLL